MLVESEEGIPNTIFSYICSFFDCNIHVFCIEVITDIDASNTELNEQQCLFVEYCKNFNIYIVYRRKHLKNKRKNKRKHALIRLLLLMIKKKM